MALVMAVPVVIAVLYRFGSEPADDPIVVAADVVGALILTLLLPLVALVLGTGSLGAGREDGTVVFLLTKPVARGRIVAVTTLTAGLATMALAVPATVATAWIIAAGSGPPDAPRLALGLGLTAAVASLLYAAVFVALSAWTGRALVVGLAYVFLWEVFATSLFEPLRWLSIRAYAAGWSRLLVTVRGEVFTADMSPAAAVAGTVVLVALSLLLGTVALTRFQARGGA